MTSQKNKTKFKKKKKKKTRQQKKKKKEKRQTRDSDQAECDPRSSKQAVPSFSRKGLPPTSSPSLSYQRMCKMR